MATQRVVVITGASSGIGAALARLLGNEGAKLVLGARRADRLRRIAAEIDPSGANAIAFPTDVTVRAQAERLIETALDRFGRIDVLVNNAGRGHLGSVEETSDAVIKSMFELNVFALWYTTRPALHAMRTEQSGHIITVALGKSVFHSTARMWQGYMRQLDSRMHSGWNSSGQISTRR